MKRRVLLIIAAVLLLLPGCAPGADNSALTSQADATESAAWEDVEIPFAAQYIRTDGYASDLKYPETAVIRSVSGLEEYYAAKKDVYDLGSREKASEENTIGFADAAKKYDEAYFKDNVLILVLLEEPSGSIRHNVSSVTAGDSGISITIKRLLPETGTDDMAEWHIIVETGKECTDGEIRVKLVDKQYTENSTKVPFAAQYARTDGLVPDRKYPVTTVIRSEAELMQYFTANRDIYNLGDNHINLIPEVKIFADAMKKYDDAYFENNALILILLMEPSGTIGHNVRSVISDGSAVNITVERLVPAGGTCDEAEWHIFVEIEKKYAAGDVNIELTENKEIPFTAQYIKTGGYFEEPETVVIRSASELMEYYAANKDAYTLGDYDKEYTDVGFAQAIEKYNDAYFKNRALIFIRLSEGGIPLNYSVKSVSGKDRGITITLQRLVGIEQDMVMASWHIFVEIPKKYAADDVSIGLKVKESKQLPFAAQYIRTNGYVSGRKYPVTTVVRSASDMMEYYSANKDTYGLGSREKVYADSTIGFADAMKKYDDSYFKDNVLILVLLEEPSGSIRHNLSSVIDAGGSLDITIERLLPEMGTDDMAEWHIFVEVAKDKAGDNISVSFTNVRD